jgi:diguanylate cyclase (GGDEF)-like protein/PAS domain S-box-containing protein
MNYVIIPYVRALFFSSFIALFVAMFAWRRRSAPGGMALFGMMLGIAEWSLAAGLEAAAVEQATKIFWSQVEYLGYNSAIVLLLVFAAQFTQQTHWLNRRNLLLLPVIPALTIILAFTNAWHHLVWASFAPGPPGTNSLIYYHGPWFWVGMAWVYVIMFIATVMFASQVRRSRGVYRHQAVAVLIASLAPWIGSGLYVFGFVPTRGFDTGPISFMLTGVLLVWSFARYQLLGLVPIAREVLIEKMSDGVIVVDARNRVVDINPAAYMLLNLSEGHLIGQSAQAVLPPQLGMTGMNTEATPRHEEFCLNEAKPLWVELLISPLRDRSDTARGQLVVLRDITQRKLDEGALQQAKRSLEAQLVEIKNLQEQLKEQAIRDALTGLYNRRYLEETLDRELARASRERYPITLVMVDIDDFKRVNDSYGHPVGDLVLQALGKLLYQHTRRSDIACRYGGEEFLLVLPGLAIERAVRRADEWRTAFETLCIQASGGEIRATFSAGIAVFPIHGTQALDLIRAADQALYAAKAQGRNCVRLKEV